MTTHEEVVDVSQDWILACHVQQQFMHGPGQNGISVDYSAQCRQVGALGGDCYDFMSFADDRVAMFVGDASGKGLAAALMMASVQSSLRTAASFTGDNLATLLKVVNAQAYVSSLADRYATVFYGVFDKKTRTLRYVNAGHNPPVVLRENGSIDWLEPNGAPVGMFPDSHYQESSVQLASGDLVMIYTDGVTEVSDRCGEEWGVEGLLKAGTTWKAQHAGGAEDLVQFVFRSMDNFSDGCQIDDVTLAALCID